MATSTCQTCFGLNDLADYGAQTVVLRDGALWSGTGAMTVRCIRGCVWLTQAGDRRDVILRASQSFLTTGAGKVVVQSIDGTSTIRVELNDSDA